MLLLCLILITIVLKSLIFNLKTTELWINQNKKNIRIEAIKEKIQAFLTIHARDIDTSVHNETAEKLQRVLEMLESTASISAVYDNTATFDTKLSQTKSLADRGQAKPLLESLEKLVGEYAKMDKKEQSAHKKAFDELATQSEVVLAQYKGAAKAVSNRTCGEEMAPGWNPFVRISYYAPSCTIQYANLDPYSKRPYLGEWERDDVNTAFFKMFSSAVDWYG